MIKKIILILFLCLTFTACSTTHYKGDGVILSQKKITNPEFNPHKAKKTGAIVGGSAGAVTGSAIGGAVGCVYGALIGYSGLGILITTLGGGVIGALALGTAGAAIGTGTGYMIDSINHPNSYQYIVQPSYQTETITITQRAANFPNQSKVKILEKDHAMYIERN